MASTRELDPSLFKDVTTSRGIKYHYYFSPAEVSRPTILFCHGFPSTSRDWRHIILHLQPRGYGILAPDMLGYGGTDKPTDPAAYVSSLLTKDIVDILDAEKLDKVVALGHDWGSKLVSRLASWYPERFVAYAFLALGFLPVTPAVDIQTFLDTTKKEHGSELFGYWLFFSEDDADSVIQAHIDSFVSTTWPYDPAIWKTHVIPVGAAKAALLSDFRAPLPSYVSEEDKQVFIETFRRGGFQAPTCWYKVMTSGLSALDDGQIPKQRLVPPPTAPIFFGAATHDYICIPALGTAVLQGDEFKGHSITIKEYDSDHWVPLSKAEEVSRDLNAWIEGFLGKA